MSCDIATLGTKLDPEEDELHLYLRLHLEGPYIWSISDTDAEG